MIRRSGSCRFCSSTLVAAPAGAQTLALTGAKVFPVSQPADRERHRRHRQRQDHRGRRQRADSGRAPSASTPRQVDHAGLDRSASPCSASSRSAPCRSRTTRAPRATSRCAAAFRVWDGLNPASVCGRRRATKASPPSASCPTGGLIAGQAAVVDLVDGTRDRRCCAATRRRSSRSCRAARRPTPRRAATCCCGCASCCRTRRSTRRTRQAYEHGAHAGVRDDAAEPRGAGAGGSRPAAADALGGSRRRHRHARSISRASSRSSSCSSARSEGVDASPIGSPRRTSR